MSERESFWWFVPDEAQQHVSDCLGGSDDGTLWLVEDARVVLDVTHFPHESRNSPTQTAEVYSNVTTIQKVLRHGGGHFLHDAETNIQGSGSRSFGKIVHNDFALAV